MIKDYKGCIRNPEDSRDIRLGDIPYIPDPKCPSFAEGFDNEEKYGKLKREHQGSSLSCVGQGWSKYVEMLNLIETKKATDLSARFIYSQIALNNGGAYIRDGAKIVTKQGDALQINVPDYMNGLNPNESFMKSLEGVDDARPSAKIYKSLKYVWLDADKVNDDMRQIIWQYGGFVSGYNGHCEFYSKFSQINNIDAVCSIGSYGAGSDRWITKDSPHRMYDATFLVDLPNSNNNMKLIQKAGTKEVYAVVDNIRYWILDPVTLESGEPIWGIWGTIHQEDPSKYTYGGAIFITKTDDPLK